MNFGGKLEVSGQGRRRTTCASSTSTLEHLTQRWLYGKELKLRLYQSGPATGPHGSVELIVRDQAARRARRRTTAGTYVLTVYHILPRRAGGDGKTITLRGTRRPARSAEAACAVTAADRTPYRIRVDIWTCAMRALIAGADARVAGGGCRPLRRGDHAGHGRADRPRRSRTIRSPASSCPTRASWTSKPGGARRSRSATTRTRPCRASCTAIPTACC